VESKIRIALFLQHLKVFLIDTVFSADKFIMRQSKDSVSISLYRQPLSFRYSRVTNVQWRLALIALV
jgi:hypothetical protein